MYLVWKYSIRWEDNWRNVVKWIKNIWSFWCISRETSRAQVTWRHQSPVTSDVLWGDFIDFRLTNLILCWFVSFLSLPIIMYFVSVWLWIRCPVSSVGKLLLVSLELLQSTVPILTVAITGSSPHSAGSFSSLTDIVSFRSRARVTCNISRSSFTHQRNLAHVRVNIQQYPNYPPHSSLQPVNCRVQIFLWVK